jgi:hypothetical protein
MSSIAIQRGAPAANANGNSASAQIFALASNPLVPVTVAAPGAGAINGRRFTLRAEGAAYASVAAYTVRAALYAALTIPASPLTAANWTLLGTGTARAVAAPGWVPWWIEADLIFDSNGGLMQGAFSQMANNLFDVKAAITNPLTGLNGTNVPVNQAGTVVQPANPACYFAAGIVFGTASSNNIGTLVNFEVGF